MLEPDTYRGMLLEYCPLIPLGWHSHRPDHPSAFPHGMSIMAPHPGLEV